MIQIYGTVQAAPVTKVLRAYRAEKADKVVLAEDSYLADLAHCHTAYHRRGYRHMEVFSAVCYQECH